VPLFGFFSSFFSGREQVQQYEYYTETSEE